VDEGDVAVLVEDRPALVEEGEPAVAVAVGAEAGDGGAERAGVSPNIWRPQM
jgi:hypothetical protein